MSKFILEIETDNAAFERPNGEAEIARILRKVADSVEGYRRLSGTERDYNGNTVCKFNTMKD
jgi:hypothetical protein